MTKQSFKSDFINYVLFNYEFDNHIVIWILNFIKSHPQVSTRFYYNHTDHLKKVLYVNSSTSKRPSILLEKQGTVIVDAETIFHELNLNQLDDFQIIFDLGKNDQKYERVKLKELFLINDLEFDDIDSIKAKIDEALDNNDRSLFIELSRKLDLYR